MMDDSSLLLSSMSLHMDRAVEHLISLKSLKAGDAGRLDLGDGGSSVGGGSDM